MSERKSKVSNGKTKYLNSLSGHLEFCEDAKKTILDKSLFNAMSESQNGVIQLPRSTLLIGDKLYNNVWHPADELQKSFTSMEHQPFIMNHGDNIEDEIGFMENVEYDPETKKLTAIPVLNLNTEKGMTALNHMRNRLMANKAPETSVGFWATEHLEQISMLENAEHLSARDWEFDHNSLVTRGAGSPEMGIGIGLSKYAYPKNIEIKLNILGDQERMENQTPIEKPKVEPEKFTMSREEFREEMKQMLAKQEAELKQKQTNADKPADKTPELDAKDKKIAELEKQLSTRTTATRDNMVTDGAPGASSRPINPKTKAIRSQVIGMAVIKTLAQTDSDVHIHYVNEQNLPPGAR